MTYSWSLSWANVDKAFYVEQETKAGFWNQDIQVFLIKEYIQGLCMSLGGINITKNTLVLMFDRVKHQCSGVTKNKITLKLSDISQLTIFTN